MRDAAAAAVDRFHQDQPPQRHRRNPPCSGRGLVGGHGALRNGANSWGSLWIWLYQYEGHRHDVPRSSFPCLVTVSMSHVLLPSRPCYPVCSPPSSPPSSRAVMIWLFSPGCTTRSGHQVTCGMPQAAEVVSRVGVVFPYLDAESWFMFRPRLRSCDLSTLQAYPAWRHLSQEVPIWGCQRTDIYEGSSGQRYASSSARGLVHLLVPGGWGRRVIRQPLLSCRPLFCPRDWPASDIGFCC